MLLFIKRDLNTVHNKCEEVPELVYDDGLRFIYFKAKGTKGGNCKQGKSATGNEVRIYEI